MLLFLCCLQLVVADSGNDGAAAVAAVMAVVVKKPKDVEGCDSLLSHTKVKFKILLEFKCIYLQHVQNYFSQTHF